MKRREVVEIVLFPFAVAGLGAFGNVLPTRISLGSLIAVSCVGWLVQGGLRDLWLLHLTRTSATDRPRGRVACMCLESTAGMTGIVIGVALALTVPGAVVSMTTARWMTLAAGVLLVGFLAKDYIVTWKPVGIRREPDHHTFIFTWR